MILQKDVENFGCLSVRHASLRTDYVPDTHEGMVVPVRLESCSCTCLVLGNPFVGGLVRLGAVIWISQCNGGTMSVQYVIYIYYDHIIPVFYRFSLSLQANGSQYIYCAVSKEETTKECVNRDYRV